MSNMTKKTAFDESFLAHRVKSVKPSPTLAVMGKANKLKRDGHDIIILAAGEPDADTPDFIKDAAKDALDQGLTKYTAVDGLPELKQAIQRKMKHDNNLDYDLNQILVGVGGKQIIWNALLATCQAGDEVIIPAPYWVSYPDMVRLCDATPVAIACTYESGFKLTPDTLRKSLTPHTKWIILNSPSNPTGAVYTREELMALGDVLRDHHALILSDDIYEYLIYEMDDAPAPEFYNLPMVCPDLKDRTLIVNGVSKSYSMTGWRIGYAAGPKCLIENMTMLQSQSTSNACSIAQAASIAALNGDRSFLNEWKTQFKERRDFCVHALNHMDGLKCSTPAGAFYMYVSCEDLLGCVFEGSQHNAPIHLRNDDDVAQFFLDVAGVAVVAGSAFGLSGHFRISYATSLQTLEDACRRLRDAIAQLRRPHQGDACYA